jgi:hypothetical protein
MSGITAEERLALRTPEASFAHVLQSKFNLSPRGAQEVGSTASEMLGLDRPGDQIRPGQVRLVVASLQAPFGPPLSETGWIEVTLAARRKTLKVQEDL